ncbi:MAG TPA: hypothetical protein VKR24_12805 [Candidatus Limnocylindrales bacterium]|nr:hypothetical protein [Candidatus Limnocylindrales bacterium]
MSSSLNPTTPALLTREQVGVRLDLTPARVDRLVASGELSSVRVSSGNDQRFWPDEVIAYALRAEICTDVSVAQPGSEAPQAEAAVAAPIRLQRGRLPRRPAWPPFTGPVERHVPAYIAFAHRDDLVRYLRRRALIEVA